MPDVATVTPVVTDNDVGHVADRYAAMAIEGSSLDYLSVTDRRLATGRWFSPGQARTSARVVVLGPQLVARLFGGNDRAAVGNRCSDRPHRHVSGDRHLAGKRAK